VTTHQKKQRNLAFLMGGISLVLAFVVYQTQQNAGFPDGFLSELARAQQMLFSFFVWISAVAGLWFFVLGWLAAKRNAARQLNATLVVYVLTVVVVFGVDIYLRQILDSGGG
jgi:cellulose synthase/poly-beta-1,6-N-acetylglucosamine synthase-like glycosyltransferase